MEHFIKDLHIKNFKSIKEVSMDCSRINLIVGKPNVGKSNILEALSLFCAPYSRDKEKFLSEFIRYNAVEDFFFDQDINEIITVKTNLFNAILFDLSAKEKFKLIIGEAELIDAYLELEYHFVESQYAKLKNSPSTYYEFSNHGHLDNETGRYISDSVKKYLFKQPKFNNLNGRILMPPFGDNLFSTILTNSVLKKEIGEWFKEYKLDLVLDKRSKTLSVQKREDNVVYPIAYNLIADTLQRIIFHYAAIESNKDAILLFEEPESHSFPPYIYELANKIIDDENNNQYFITTHSPHLFNTIVERTEREELSVFIASYKDYQTVLKKLSTDDLSELLDYGIDIFFNQKYFLDE